MNKDAIIPEIKCNIRCKISDNKPVLDEFPASNKKCWFKEIIKILNVQFVHLKGFKGMKCDKNVEYNNKTQNLLFLMQNDLINWKKPWNPGMYSAPPPV